MKNKEIEQYLNDLDNLLEVGFFDNIEIKDYTFYHKELNLKDFIRKGRELLKKSNYEK